MMRVGCVQGQACQASNSLTFSECLEWGAMPRPRPDMPTQGKPRHPKLPLASLSRNVLNGEQCQGQAKARHAKAKQGKACQGQGMPRPRHAKDTTCQGQGTTCQRKQPLPPLKQQRRFFRRHCCHTPPFWVAPVPKELGHLPLPIPTNLSRWNYRCWLEIEEIWAVFGLFLTDFSNARLGVSDGQILRSRYAFSSSRGALAADCVG
ncbi:hypothetical protein GBA52_013009 [Prunus armeniaca]|nr:hypothetical protein GBA52_013009 [Prunus armeniaca]